MEYMESMGASLAQGAASAREWCTNNPRRCLLLGGVALGAGLVGMHVLYPAASQSLMSLASQVGTWATTTAFPDIKQTWQATIVPAVSSKWTSLCEALYTNGTMTKLSVGLIGCASALTTGAVIHVVYRFYSHVKAERDLARRERDAAISSLRDARDRCGQVEEQREAAIEARNKADDARKKADVELARIQSALEQTIETLGNAYQARVEVERQRDVANVARVTAEQERDQAIGERNAAKSELSRIEGDLGKAIETLGIAYQARYEAHQQLDAANVARATAEQERDQAIRERDEAQLDARLLTEIASEV